jgi:GT2 family glycosyltransferase
VPDSFSVVIPSHNRPDLLRACLASVTRHAPTATEIVVVDDGSPQQEVSRVAAGFAGIRVVRLASRQGFCAAANAGIAAAGGDIVELLNDDTEVTAGWAEAALAPFADASIGAVAPLVLCRSGQGAEAPLVDSAGDRYYLGGVAGKRGHRQRLAPDLLRPCRVFGASASSAFYRRESLLQVGGFPSGFGAYFEDVDLAFRLHWAGYQVVFEPGARVLHHVSASYGRPQRRLLEWQSRNEERVFWRNLPAQTLARALPQHLAVLAAKAWRRWDAGELRPFLCGRLRLLGEIPELLRHRRWLRQLGNPADIRRWEVESRYWGRP